MTLNCSKIITFLLCIPATVPILVENLYIHTVWKESSKTCNDGNMLTTQYAFTKRSEL